MPENKKLLLLDSYALIFRAYYAFIKNPMRNAEGMNTSPVFGFLLALDDVIRKESPTHIVAAFDASGPTFRHDMYPEYKATRDATPEDIKEAVPWVKKLLEAYRIPIIEKLGFEADDLIGAMAKRAEKQGFQVYMMTPDKDYAQLVSENIYMLKPGRSGNPPEIIGIEEVKEKFHVKHPEQVIDILALMGDASDNIPGAAGIGEKTAKKLIEAYGSTEGVYEHIDQITGKQREKLEQSKENVELSKILARIDLNAPLDVELSETERKAIDRELMEVIFSTLEFKNIGQRILGSEIPTTPSLYGSQGSLFEDKVEYNEVSAPALNTIETVDHNYRLIDSDESFSLFLNKLISKKKYCFDTETTGLDVIDDELVGLSFSWSNHEAYYLDLNGKNLRNDPWIEQLKEIFQDAERTVVGQNLKFDLHILKNYGIEVKGKLFDTMVAHFLVRPNRKHGIDAIAEEYLGYRKIKTEELIGRKGSNQLNFGQVDINKVSEYAGEDADITWQVYQILETELIEFELEKLANNIEFPLIRVLVEMEKAGATINREALNDFAGELRTDLIQLEKDIFKLAGMEFNISSPKQLGEVLFTRMKIAPDAKKTKTKQFSTSEDVLLDLIDTHEIVQKVLDYRSSRKLLNTYVEALPKLIHKSTGKIHTSFNQTLVATGRLSSNNPNLQNIPIREERGREIRRAFTSSSTENLFISADYSQIELRIMAHFSDDKNMIEAFINEEDIHTATAAKINGISQDEVTREMRSKAKTANFGIIYGISAFGLAQRMRISRSEAKALIDGYFNTYPGVKIFMDHCIEQARSNGFVKTLFGRRQQLPDILSRNSVIRGNAERNAINTPIQGTAADIIKIAMVRIHSEFQKEGLKAKMIIQVHDELNFDIPKGEIEQVKRIVRDSMEHAVSLKVPMSVEMNSGMNWLEAH